MNGEPAYNDKMPAKSNAFLTPQWLSLAASFVFGAVLGAVEFGEIRNSISSLQGQLIDRTQDRYTGTDAARDQVPVQIQIQALQAEQARLWAEFDKYPPPYLLEQVRSLHKRVYELESERDGKGSP